MLRVGAIGSGNTGNQIVALAHKELDIPVIAINSSKKDLDTVKEDIMKILIDDKDVGSQGAGKNRDLAKTYLKSSVKRLIENEQVIEMLVNLDVLFLVSSMGGGTGSGINPMLYAIINGMFQDLIVIMVGVAPVEQEALSAQVNTLQYLNEMYTNLPNCRYMLYDNDNYSDEPSYIMMQKVNEEVVKDIDVIRCRFNHETQYDSIDTEDMLHLISFPGRIAVARVEDVKEKDLDKATLEERLISDIKKNAHMELQRDKKVMSTGLITNLSDQFMAEFNTHVPRVHDFIGEPVQEFSHVSVNEDRKDPNSVYLIMSGLSPVNDKIAKINDRIAEIEERQRIQEESSLLNRDALSKLTDNIRKNDGRSITDDGNLSIESIFNQFS